MVVQYARRKAPRTTWCLVCVLICCAAFGSLLGSRSISSGESSSDPLEELRTNPEAEENFVDDQLIASALSDSFRRRRVLFSARTLFGKLRVSEDDDQRRVASQIAADAVSALLVKHDDDRELVLELMTIQGRIQCEQNDFEAARETVEAQQSLYAEHFGDEAVSEWIPRQAETLRNQGAIDLAILHLEELIEQVSDDRLSARYLLLVGDLLIQKAGSNGTYDDAIQNFKRVTDEFGEAFPDIADDARLRHAKALWRYNQFEEAKQLFKEIETTTVNQAVAEEASHYPELMEAIARSRSRRSNGLEID